MRPVTDLQRRVAPFEVISDFQPSGDQPTAIADIERRITAGGHDGVLLGATGTGKTAALAGGGGGAPRPPPGMQPNKTRAAPFGNQPREALPHKPGRDL